MTIAFTANDRPTIGVELELHLVDSATGDLTSASERIIGALGSCSAGGSHPNVKHELFQSTVEVITGICETPAEARDDLRATIADLLAVATPLGIDVMSAGTHPFALAADQIVSPFERYYDLVDAMQWPARRLLICGMHVHVAVTSAERSIAVINELTRWLPVFLALSASSPYFEGEDSGLASARAKVFESLPTAGLPPQIADWSDFESFMSTLLDAGCIHSIREVWWDIRPHPDFGTVELRMCDAPHTLDEVAALAALAQALVVWCETQIDLGALPPAPREWTVRENRWLAGRYGTDAELIVESPDGSVARRPIGVVLSDLVEMLEPIAESLGSSAELARTLTILDTGSGTARQRRVVSEGGDLLDVVRFLVAEFRSGLDR